MGRVAQADLGAIFAFLASSRVGGRIDPISVRTLRQLRDLLRADDAEYFEMRRADRAVLAAVQTDEIPSAPGTVDAMLAFGHQNPLNWRRWTPAHGALRLSDQVRRREFERSEFYQEFMRPNGLRDTLKVWLWSTASSAACVQLWRVGGDFSRRDQDVLAVLHHHLIAMRERALRAADTAPAAVGLTVREAEVVTWAARGASDAAIGARLGIARSTVNKHLEHAYASLGVHSRAEAIGRILLGPPDSGEDGGALDP